MQYVPTDYLDEVSPPPRASANDWIVSLDDGAPALDKACDYSTEETRHALHDGQIVAFSTFMAYGDTTLHLQADGTFTVEDVMPAGAENCAAGNDPDTLSSSIEELAQRLHDSYGSGEAQEFDVAYYTWADAPPLRFDAATRTFAHVEAAAPGESGEVAP